MIDHQGCALAEPSGPWHLTYALGQLENLRFFIRIICWAPFNFPQSTAMIMTTYFSPPVVADLGCRKARLVLSLLNSSPCVVSSLSLASLVTVISLEERMLLLPLITEAPDEGVPVARRIGVKSFKQNRKKVTLYNDIFLIEKKADLLKHNYWFPGCMVRQNVSQLIARELPNFELSRSHLEQFTSRKIREKNQ